MSNDGKCLSPATEWVSAMPRSKQLFIATSTAPLLLKYGYPLSGVRPVAKGRR
jgi:hypothetical protein